MNVWIELLKLGAQLVGAAVVAKLAVRWALERFKTERSWERQMAALVDVVTAMGAMERVAKQRLDDFFSESRTGETRMLELRELHREAELKLQEVSAAARLTLPRRLADHISQTEDGLNEIEDNPNHEQSLLLELEVLETRSEELIEMGRSIFDADAASPPNPLSNPIMYIHHRNRIRLSYADEKQK